jgi:KDO2-lipid IV(A) lauroyltransferase
MDKTSRGKDRLTDIPYPRNVKTDPEYATTKWHVKQLEEQIYRKPELWLWSHKKWKYQHLYDGQPFE